ncbi:hypothetical protein [Microlunatus parietis]|uniref:Uncharacterized protein n=1 Tax=Microlunatus parietis TaxID=682979 RepID=A0A7Y9LEF7_9ACTN|nr:hypothetical protein [Microlunatus parietis]NYE73845.1 hypothetical protein [Microlunatus parietis]
MTAARRGVENRGDGFGWGDGDVLLIVDDNPAEECPVEHAAFGWSTLSVEVGEVVEQVEDGIEAVAGAVVGGAECFESTGGSLQ